MKLGSTGLGLDAGDRHEISEALRNDRRVNQGMCQSQASQG